jgi:hypothetical protein
MTEMNVKKLSMFEHEVRVLSFSSLKLFLATMAKREVWDALQSFENSLQRKLMYPTRELLPIA